MRARDIMTRTVITASPDATVADVAQKMVDQRISAIPVVGSDDHVIGIVSEGDLLRRAEIGTTVKRSRWLEIFITTEQLAREFAVANARFARDVMTTAVVSVAEDESLDEIAELLETHGIKRVPVLRYGKLVGIVSRADLVRTFAAGTATEPAARADDAEISRRFRERLRSEPWANSAWVNYTVRAGTVDLWGLVASEERRRALRILAESIPGVVRVQSHFSSTTNVPGAD